MTLPQSPFATLMDIAPRPPVVFADGQGSWLYDTRANATSTWCRAGP